MPPPQPKHTHTHSEQWNVCHSCRSVAMRACLPYVPMHSRKAYLFTTHNIIILYKYSVALRVSAPCFSLPIPSPPPQSTCAHEHPHIAYNIIVHINTHKSHSSRPPPNAATSVAMHGMVSCMRLICIESERYALCFACTIPFEILGRNSHHTDDVVCRCTAVPLSPFSVLVHIVRRAARKSTHTQHMNTRKHTFGNNLVERRVFRPCDPPRLCYAARTSYFYACRWSQRRQRCRRRVRVCRHRPYAVGIQNS